MPDLTRFDFHVNRFMNSYTVDLMDSSEVGQYILLLCKSWQIGKDCCLPDDIPYLSRHARVPEVSPKVLACFPTVETEQGTMRRNGPLYEEWQKAVARSVDATVRAAGRGEKWAAAAAEKIGMPVLIVGTARRNAAADAAANAPASSSAMPIPYHTNPTHTIPTHTNPNTTGGVGGVVSSTQEKTLGEWKNLAVKHKRYFGTQASTGHKDKYAKACSEYGEEIVLQAFEEWVVAGAREWVDRNGVKQPLFAFWKQLPDLAETLQGEAEVVAAETAEAAREEEGKKALAGATEALVQRQMREHAAFMESKPAPTIGECEPEL